MSFKYVEIFESLEDINMSSQWVDPTTTGNEGDEDTSAHTLASTFPPYTLFEVFISVA